MAVSKHGKKWKYDFWHDGKRYRKFTFDTKREAIKAESELMNDLENGYQSDNKITLVEYARKWEEVNKGHLSNQTRLQYRKRIDDMQTYFQDMKFKDITRMKFQEFMNWYGLEAFNHVNERGRSLNSVEKMLGTFRAIVKSAIFDGVIKKDFTINVNKVYRVAKVPDENKFLELKDFRKLRDYLKENGTSDIDVILFIMTATGARYSDVIYTQYKDIDDKNNTIRLRGTKTINSDRVVSVSQNDMDYIAPAVKNLPFKAHGRIFCSHETQYPKSNGYIAKRLREICRDLDIKEVNPHALRHTHASALIHAGNTIQYISRRLGHASTIITQETYIHLLQEHDAEQDAYAMEYFNKYM